MVKLNGCEKTRTKMDKRDPSLNFEEKVGHLIYEDKVILLF